MPTFQQAQDILSNLTTSFSTKFQLHVQRKETFTVAVAFAKAFEAA